MANKALHLTAFPLRSKAAGELERWAQHKPAATQSQQEH